MHTHAYVAAPPAPKEYTIILDQLPRATPGAVAFNFTSDPTFNFNYAITAYRIRPQYMYNGNRELPLFGSLIECPSLCSPDAPCQCTGLEMGVYVTVAISAINCENQEGPAVVITVATSKHKINIHACFNG